MSVEIRTVTYLAASSIASAITATIVTIVVLNSTAGSISQTASAVKVSHTQALATGSSY